MIKMMLRLVVANQMNSIYSNNSKKNIAQKQFLNQVNLNLILVVFDFIFSL